jgi:hypothetical protein
MSFFKHGHGGRKSRTPEYRAWAHAIDRCYDPKDKKFHLYGGRGIKMCDSWRYDFTAFLHDIGPKPSPKHWLDRADNDKDYEPGNCRWVLPLESGRNVRTIVKVDYNGQQVRLCDLPSIVSTKVLHTRIFYLGWTIERAISTPVKA